MKAIRNVVAKITTYFNYVGLVVCFAMVIIVAVDIILRKVSNSAVSIRGSNEFSNYFLVVVCALGIPFLQLKDGHVWVNMFVNRMPSRFRGFWRASIMVVETLLIFALLVGSIIKVKTFGTVAHTDVLNIPKWIFAAVMCVGFGEMFLLLALDTIQLFIDTAKGKSEAVEESWSEDQVKGV